MPKFRRKSAVVNAEQFMHPSMTPAGVFVTENGSAYVITAHAQRVYLEPGDWILPEPNGDGYYPVKPDIFAATYEEA